MTSTSSNDLQVLRRIQIQISTDPNAAEQLLSWFEALNDPPLPDRVIWWQCQTVLKEGFDNVVEYAHRDLPTETPIQVEAVRFPNRIELRIWDSGSPFDLMKKMAEMPELDANDADHGRGLKIMQKIADQISYLRTEDHRNCLFVTKHY